MVPMMLMSTRTTTVPVGVSPFLSPAVVRSTTRSRNLVGMTMLASLLAFVGLGLGLIAVDDTHSTNDVVTPTMTTVSAITPIDSIDLSVTAVEVESMTGTTIESTADSVGR